MRNSSAQIFRWLVKQDRPVRSRDAAAHFSCELSAMSQCLQRLARNGAVRRDGRTHRAVWSVIDPHADVSSLAGTHQNSLRNLKFVMTSRRPRWNR